MAPGAVEVVDGRVSLKLSFARPGLQSGRIRNLLATLAAPAASRRRLPHSTVATALDC